MKSLASRILENYSKLNESSIKEDILSIISEGNFEYYGLRVIENKVSVNTILPESRRWFDGDSIYKYQWVDKEEEGEIDWYVNNGYSIIDEETAMDLAEKGYHLEDGMIEDKVLLINKNEFDTLNGTSAIYVNEENIDYALSHVSIYFGDFLLLLGTNDSCEEGEDEGEIVMPNAKVLYIGSK